MTYAPHPAPTDLSSAEARPLDSLLAQQLTQRADAVAVFFKVRGLYRTETWGSLARAVRGAESAGTPPPRSLRWLIAALVDAARVATESAPAAPLELGGEDLLWLEPGLVGPAREQVLGAWLHSDARLGISEAADTADADRRELAPTVVLADGSWYEALVDSVLTRVAAGSRPRRALIGWALGVSSAGHARGVQRVLAKLLVLRPLSAQLGLSRVRLLLVSGPINERARALFASLGLSLRTVESEVDAPSERRQLSASAPDEACLVGSTELQA